MTYDEGASVLAIRDSDDTTLYVYGEGVYVGDRLRPGAAWPCSPDDYRDDGRGGHQERRRADRGARFVHFYDLSVEANPDIPPKKDRETMIADLLVEREQPLDDRVRELWEGQREPVHLPGLRRHRLGLPVLVGSAGPRRHQVPAGPDPAGPGAGAGRQREVAGMMRLTYDSGTGDGYTVWEKTLEEFLTPNGTESLLVWMLRELQARGAYFRLESIE